MNCMNRRSFLALTAGAALTGQSSAGTAAKDDGWPTRETLNKLFRQYAEYFRSHLSERYKALPLEIGGDDWILGREDESESSYGQAGEPCLLVQSPPVDLSPHMCIQVGKSGQVIQATACIYELVARFKDSAKLQAKALLTWDLPEAVTRAHAALKALGWEVPPDMRLGHVGYSTDLGGCLRAVWNRTFGGIPEISSNAAPDQIRISINVNGEGADFVRWRRGPVPEATTPKLTSGEAMDIALKAIPAFLEGGAWTAHLLSAVLKNPVLREYKGTGLCVTNPNWVTDRGRFELDIGYPRERRLCWRSTFLFQEKTGAMLNESGLEPDRNWVELEIHVDALTGEVMGGRISGSHEVR